MPHNYHDELQHDINIKADEIISELPDFAQRFFNNMKTIDRSARTRLQYAYDIKRFFSFVQAQPGFKDVDLHRCSNASILDLLSFDDIQEYLNTLNESSYTDSTGNIKEKTNSSSFKARNISALRSFYKFYFKHGDIEKDMANLLEIPKVKNIEKFPLDKSQVQRMLDAIDSHADKTNVNHRYRDKAILTLLFGTGIRVSELVAINVEDIDFYNASILITRKGGDQDIVYFATEVEQALQLYLENERSLLNLANNEHALFLSNRKQRISVRMVQEMMNTYSKEAGINMKVTPHTARRTFGTALYDASGDLYLVADSLHHSSIQTTRRYAKMSEDHKRMAQKLSSGLFTKD